MLLPLNNQLVVQASKRRLKWTQPNTLTTEDNTSNQLETDKRTHIHTSSTELTNLMSSTLLTMQSVLKIMYS